MRTHGSAEGRRGGLLVGLVVAAALVVPGAASASWSAAYNNGSLLVSSNAGDAIAISCSSATGNGNVRVNGADVAGSGGLPATCSSVNTIQVGGGSGDNTI